eukprot:m.247108 g.247108  ORF g.247108 m.247108 type:complete len:523 (-) comp15293_c0_seq1:93-1661(-)
MAYFTPPQFAMQQYAMQNGAYLPGAIVPPQKMDLSLALPVDGLSSERAQRMYALIQRRGEPLQSPGHAWPTHDDDCVGGANPERERDSVKRDVGAFRGAPVCMEPPPASPSFVAAAFIQPNQSRHHEIENHADSDSPSDPRESDLGSAALPDQSPPDAPQPAPSRLQCLPSITLDILDPDFTSLDLQSILRDQLGPDPTSPGDSLLDFLCDQTDLDHRLHLAPDSCDPPPSHRIDDESLNFLDLDALLTVPDNLAPSLPKSHPPTRPPSTSTSTHRDVTPPGQISTHRLAAGPVSRPEAALAADAQPDPPSKRRRVKSSAVRKLTLKLQVDVRAESFRKIPEYAHSFLSSAVRLTIVRYIRLPANSPDEPVRLWKTALLAHPVRVLQHGSFTFQQLLDCIPMRESQTNLSTVGMAEAPVEAWIGHPDDQRKSAWGALIKAASIAVARLWTLVCGLDSELDGSAEDVLARFEHDIDAALTLTMKAAPHGVTYLPEPFKFSPAAALELDKLRAARAQAKRAGRS